MCHHIRSYPIHSLWKYFLHKICLCLCVSELIVIYYVYMCVVIYIWSLNTVSTVVSEVFNTFYLLILNNIATRS